MAFYAIKIRVIDRLDICSNGGGDYRERSPIVVQDDPRDILLDGSKLGYKVVYFCSPFHHKQFYFFAQQRIPSFCKFSEQFEKGPISIPSIKEDLFFTFE